MTHTFARALGRLDPDRAVGLLESNPDVESSGGRRLVFALLEARGVPDPLRLAWIVRLLEAGYSSAIAHAATTTAESAPPVLVAPLCRMLARTTDAKTAQSVVELLARHDREIVTRELAPLLASPVANTRVRMLAACIAIGDGENVVHFLADPEPTISRRAIRWLTLHGGAQLVPYFDREARCAD